MGFDFAQRRLRPQPNEKPFSRSRSKAPWIGRPFDFAQGERNLCAARRFSALVVLPERIVPFTLSRAKGTSRDLG